MNKKDNLDLDRSFKELEFFIQDILKKMKSYNEPEKKKLLFRIFLLRLSLFSTTRGFKVEEWAKENKEFLEQYYKELQK